jgi:hypothetical protein
MRASATPASHAATVRMNSVNTCPCRLPRSRAKATRLSVTPWSIISAERNRTIRLRRVRKPIAPSTNRIAPTMR